MSVTSTRTRRRCTRRLFEWTSLNSMIWCLYTYIWRFLLVLCVCAVWAVELVGRGADELVERGGVW
jgi:hypothetical protein